MIKIILSIIILTLLIILSIFIKLTIKQKSEIQNLNYICDSTRTFRHDFNNIMQAIGGFIKTNNMYDLNEYYNRIMPECFKVNNLYKFHSKLIDNPAIFSIISNKYNLAENQNIKMSLNILTNLNNINLDSYNLSKILGILLDNAIEAASETNNKIINLSIQQLNNNIVLIIENTYLAKGLSIHKIFQKNFTTKPKNSGLGLWEISKIINKHQNLKLETKAGKDFFTQTLVIA